MLRPDICGAEIVVEDPHFAYLQLQKGKLQPLAQDRRAWLAAYRAGLDETYALLRPHLPKLCESVLDVGSGLGGIDILLSRHYAGVPEIVLLDGVDDAPQMRLHRETFSNWQVARDFLWCNGLRSMNYVAPAEAAEGLAIGRRFDLIISLGSWCFHYPPEVYLAFVRKACRPGTVLILDLRKGKPEWLAQLQSAFQLKSVLHIADKFDRVVFRAG